MKHQETAEQGKAVKAVGRHRADSEEKQRAGKQQRAEKQRAARGQRNEKRNRASDKPQPVLAAGPAANGKLSMPGTDERTSERIPQPAGSTAVADPGPAAATQSAAGPENLILAGPPVFDSPAHPALRPEKHDLLFWGIFLAGTTAGAMLWAGIGWIFSALSAFLLLLAFAAVWKVAATPPAAHPATGPAQPQPQSQSAEPLPAVEESPAAVPKPAVEEPTAGVSTGPAAATTPQTPITRREMRAADPTTGVMPVVSVFARKPDAGAKPGIPLAPAGYLAEGIDPGTGNPGSRKARRRAETSAAKSPAAAVPLPAAAREAAPAPGEATESAVAGEAAPAPGDSRWTRTFGPPETGQLPVQQYDAAAAAAVAADSESAERRQRSHSSL